VDNDDLQGDQLEGDGDNEDATSGSDNSAPPTDAPVTDKSKKRVDDLMGNWQREQARANRLEAELKQLRGEAPQQGGGTKTDDGIDEFKEFARENARVTLFNSDPRLSDYGLKPEDIAGSSLAEMRESIKKHQGLIDGLETRARNKILAEHGLEPDVTTGASTEGTPKFSEMSDAEFDKFMAARDNRRR
jgi:hypothetical protein